MISKKQCTLAGCSKFVNGRGLCQTHYHRWRRHGTTDDPIRIEICVVDGCEYSTKSKSRGLCGKHLSRQTRHGDPEMVKQPKTFGTPEERFWNYVDKTKDCWLWTGGTNRDGYGRFGAFRGSPVSSHRFSYELHKGMIADGLHVLHRCDVRHCVNPSHLFLGTHIDNMADKKAKGRCNTRPQQVEID